MVYFLALLSNNIKLSTKIYGLAVGITNFFFSLSLKKEDIYQQEIA